MSAIRTSEPKETFIIWEELAKDPETKFPGPGPIDFTTSQEAIDKAAEFSALVINHQNVMADVAKRSYRELQLSNFLNQWGKLNWQQLYLTNKQLSSLPPGIGNLTWLTTLVLSGNKLSSLPPEIGNLTGLRELYLSNNQLSSLPAEIGNLTDLTTLSLKGNPLSALPPEILKKLTALKYLYLPDESSPEEGRLVVLDNPRPLNTREIMWADNRKYLAAVLCIGVACVAYAVLNRSGII